MILSLKIQNFILVKELFLEFDKSFNVLTGETGAGKSIIIGAINAIFDKKVNKDVCYDKSFPAYLEATFSVNKDDEFLKRFDIIPENDEIFIAREFLSGGKKKSFINGRRVSQDIVFALKPYLFDFHNQNRHIRYAENSLQLDLLDNFADTKSILYKYRQLYSEILKIADSIKNMIEIEEKQKEKAELYEYQLKELEDAKLSPNEDDALEKQFETLSNAEEILNFFGELNYDFYEAENSVYDKISAKLNELGNLPSDIKVIKESKNLLNNILQNLDDVIAISHSVNDEVFVDTALLEQVKERLDTINSLKNKYGKNLSELLEYKKEISYFMANYKTGNNKIEEFKHILAEKIEKLNKLAEEISAVRKENAEPFAKQIEDNLKLLSLENAKFKIRIDKKNAYKEILSEFKIPSLNGFDKVEFLFSANREKEVQPIRDIASGGELSRIVLTIKKLLARNFTAKTLIFDEIDSGIGGKTAVVTGKFIKEIAEKSQVICVTHLPQIAAYADTHFMIEKIDTGKNTKINIERLDKKSRIKEIARMLAGNQSPKAINHAKEILNYKERTI